MLLMLRTRISIERLEVIIGFDMLEGFNLFYEIDFDRGVYERNDFGYEDSFIYELNVFHHKIDNNDTHIADDPREYARGF